MFTIDQGAVRASWYPIDRTAGATTLSVGQLVKMDTGSFNGVAPLAVASGVGDTSQLQSIFGVVIGTNDNTPTYNGTYGQYISSVQTQAQQTARKCLGNEGMFAKGDPQPLVKVARINASTVLRANIYNAAQGVPPTVVTASAVNGTAGLGMTTGEIDFTPVANMQTFYCRSGANRGLYRIGKTTSKTVHTFDTYWPFTLAIGDTFVAAPVRLGQSYVQINSTSGYIGMWIEASASPATNYFIIDVLDIDLSEAGKESVLFTFHPCHFDKVRA